jgi:hypothetical protein
LQACSFMDFGRQPPLAVQRAFRFPLAEALVDPCGAVETGAWRENGMAVPAHKEQHFLSSILVCSLPINLLDRRSVCASVQVHSRRKDEE